MTMMTPTIHSNGTSRKDLQKQLKDCYLTGNDFLEALAKAMPHGRDYYVQDLEDGCENAIVFARREHTERISQVRSVMDELHLIYHEISRGVNYDGY